MNRFVSSSILAFLGLVSFGLFATSSVAQNPRIVHTIKKERTNGPQMGKEIWFAAPQNFYSQSDKYVKIYVTAKRLTTVFVQLGNDPATRKQSVVKPYQVTTFDVTGWEMTSTDITQQKAIHVWSKDVDILAYMMSHSPATSDGMYIIPTIGWGT